VVKSRQAK